MTIFKLSRAQFYRHRTRIYLLRLSSLLCLVIGLLILTDLFKQDVFAYLLPRITPQSSTSDLNGQMAAPKPSIAKVTIVFGDNPVYQRALQTHEEHSRNFGYPMHVLQSEILDDVWTKPAFLLSIILEELVKPKTERLEWIFWFDADTVVMNPNIPIEMFLPPADFPDIHVILSKDWNGLNNGVFPIRVHPWSVKLLSAVIAYPHNFPDTLLVFRDQSALGKLLENDDYFRNSTIYAPLRWFNAYRGAPDGSINDYHPPELQLRKGDFLVHFAGTAGSDRSDSMSAFIEVAELHSPDWQLPLEATSYLGEFEAFWAQQRIERSMS